MKRKVFLFLSASLPLLGVASLSPKLEKKPVEVQAAASYIDAASGLTSLTAGEFYLFGAYAEENGTPYIYLLSYAGYGTFARVPCLSKSDANHPCAISSDDFASSCLNAIQLVSTYSGSDLCFAFTTDVSALYADPADSYAFTGSTSQESTPAVSFDSSATPTSCSLSGWEYQLADEKANFKGYATSVDSGYSTALYVYPIAANLMSNLTAVGFAEGLSSGLFTSAEAQSAYQALPRKQRELFAYYRNGYKTTAVATQAVEKILINGVTAYKALLGVSDDSGAGGIYASSTPNPVVDYALDAITGLLNEETYEFDYGTAGEKLIGWPTGGAIPFAGLLNNTAYDLTGQSNLSLKIYNDSSLGGGNIESAAVTLIIAPRLSAPASADITLASLSLTPEITTTGIDDVSITFIPETGKQYCLLPSDQTPSSFDFASASWADGPTFSGLSAETTYTIYQRFHSVTTTDSLPPYDSVKSVYLGANFTTLSALEGAKKRALVANYQAYQAQVATLGKAEEGTNLLAMLTAFKTKIEAVSSLTDLTALSTDSYRNSAFSFALQKDQSIVALTTAVALAASDSSASEAQYQKTIALISALDFFAGDDIQKAQTYASECQLSISCFRYRESKARDLVTYFNTAIVPSLSSLSDENEEKMWSSFDAAFQGIITILKEDLATTQTAVDAALSSAKSTLAALLQELSA